MGHMDVAQGQRWLCSSYNPRSTLIVPYSFKDVRIGQAMAQNSDRSTLLFFRCSSASVIVPLFAVSSVYA